MRLASAAAPALILMAWLFPPAEPDEVRAEAPQQTAAPHLFDPRVARLSAHAPERGARELLDAEQYGAAANLLEAALSVNSDRDAIGRQRYLLAEAQVALGRDEAAEVTLRLLAASQHPLADDAHLSLAELLHERAPDQAIALLAPYQEGYAFSRRARLLTAMAHKAAGHKDEAMAGLRALLASTPNNNAGAFAAIPLAELLAAEDSVEAKREAYALFQRVESRSPLSRHGREAAQRMAQLLTEFPLNVRKRLINETPEDTFIRGEALIRSHAYAEARDLFEQLAKDLKGDRVMRCKAELQQGRALIKKRDRKEGAALLAQLVERCDDKDLKAWAHYYAGQAELRLNHPSEALAHYDALAANMPDHRLADDGLFRGAIAAADADDREGMERRLRKLVEEHPDGDMHREALFTLAWDARKRGAHEDALLFFDLLAQRSDRGQPEGMHGRAAYWRARTLEDLQQKDEAIDGYEAVVRAYPLSYHAQQALAQLHRLSPERCKTLQAFLKPEDEQPLLFAYTEIMHDPAFDSAVSLLQVGNVPQAAQVLDHLGLLKRGASADDLWLVAALYDAAGALPEASAIARGRLGDFLTAPPKGVDLRKWRIAYPKAFAPLVEQAAKEASVPAAYVRAVAREESAFDPEAVSSAHAYGLIQLMRPTARQYAQQLKLPSTPAALMQPETNLRIGSHFIRFLWKRYADNPAVVPSAYNAGHGSVDRWLRAAPNKPLDAWIESIPFGETRRYTRRVLQSYGTYHFLDTGTFPPLSPDLPSRS